MILGRLRKHFRGMGLVLALTLVFVTVSGAAQQTLTTTYYKIFYDSQYSNVASKLVTYLNAAYKAAYQVLGTTGLPSTWFNSNKIGLYLYYDPNSSTNGYMYSGDTNMYLNVRYGASNVSSSTLGGYGSTVAHETSHIFFFQKLGPKSYSGSISTTEQYNLNYITEALAYYTGDSVYSYGPKYSSSQIKAQLAYYYKQMGGYLETFYGSGYRYVNGMSPVTWWQLHAIGYYLAQTGKVNTLMNNLAYYVQNPLSSSSKATYNRTTVDLNSNITEAAYMKTFGTYADQQGRMFTASSGKYDSIFRRYLKYWQIY